MSKTEALSIYRILIIDDIPEIGERLCESFSKAMISYPNKYFLSISFFHINVSDWNNCIENLANTVKDKKINFLLADKGYFLRDTSDTSIILCNPVTNYHSFFELSENSSMKEAFKTIKGILLYTYIPIPSDDNSETLFTNAFCDYEDSFKEAFEKIDTKKAIYDNVNVLLYSSEINWASSTFQKFGEIKDFKLYGYMAGSYLFHHLNFKFSKQQEEAEEKKTQTKYMRVSFSILFFAILFLVISLATSAMYDLLKGEFEKKVILILIFSIIVGTAQLFFIVKEKPSWLFQGLEK